MNVIIKLDYDEKDLNCYGLVVREEDQAMRDDDDGIFKATAPTDPYLLMPENDINAGSYEAIIEDANWQDGVYRVSVFKRIGGTPDPDADAKIGTGNIYIRNGVQVFADDNLVY